MVELDVVMDDHVPHPDRAHQLVGQAGVEHSGFHSHPERFRIVAGTAPGNRGDDVTVDLDGKVDHPGYEPLDRGRHHGILGEARPR